MRLLALAYGIGGNTRLLAVLCHGLMGAAAGRWRHLVSAQALGVPHIALDGDIQDEVVALISRGNGFAAATRGLARMAL